MEIAELKTKSVAELKELLKEQHAKLHSLKVRAKSQELKKVDDVMETRKTVARILTILNASK